jgi:hypothetical protein
MASRGVLRSRSVIQVTLTASEQEVVRYIAAQRFESNRKEKVVNAKVGKQPDDFVDLTGFGGELAFCKAFNLYPDLNIVARGGEDLADAVLPDGRRVDVKTSSHPKPNLVARKIQADIDLFVLVKGTLPTYEIFGYAERKQLADAPKRDLGHGLTHFLPAEELRPVVKDLLNVEIETPWEDGSRQILWEGCVIINHVVHSVEETDDDDDFDEPWSTEDYADYLGWDEDSGISAADWIDAFEPDYD